MTAGFGAYGKVPAHGDFLRLDLSAGFIRAWDDWLQRAVVAVRSALGERWAECYYAAPIWRFSLPPGLAGETGMSGVMMPSVDRVGREYPLVLAAPAGVGCAALRHFVNMAAFERLEEIALAALDNDTDRAGLSEALSAVRLEEPQDETGDPAAYRGAVAPEQALAARWVGERHGRPALWSAVLEGENRLLLTAGLPGPEEARALFDISAPLWAGRSMAMPA